jgi:hypothetical protein
MPSLSFKRYTQIPMALLILLACTGLSACGSSSSGSSPSTSSSTTGTTTTAAATTNATGTTQSTTSSAAGTTSTGSSESRPATTGSSKTGLTSAGVPEHYIYVLTVLARCIRRHGIKFPEPNAEGSFEAKGVNEHSPEFRAVMAKCLPTLPKGH